VIKMLSQKTPEEKELLENTLLCLLISAEYISTSAKEISLFHVSESSKRRKV